MFSAIHYKIINPNMHNDAIYCDFFMAVKMIIFRRKFVTVYLFLLKTKIVGTH